MAFLKKAKGSKDIPLQDVGSGSTPSSPSTSKPVKEKVKWGDLPHKDQLAILVMARLAEPLVQTSLQAYMFYQLKSFDTSLPDSTIAWQAGVLQASFSGAQTLTGVFWGRTADQHGRKTVLILGSLGSLISVLGFGFSRSFISALIFRSLGGLVNGNIAVMRTMVSEIIKEKKYQARAFLLMPMCFNVGVIIGPALGGFLADPVGSYPHLFGANSVFGGRDGVGWMKYWPYLTPNLASAVVILTTLCMVSLFLNETLEDAGADRARMFVRRVFRCGWFRKMRPSTTEYQQVATTEQHEPFLRDSADGQRNSSADAEPKPTDLEANPSKPEPKKKKKLAFRRIWTQNVLFTLLAHFATAFHLGTFNNLWFIFLSADRYQRPTSTDQSSPDYHPHGPFVFTGGLSLPPRLVGISMATLGVIGITLQLFIYPRANEKYGVLPPYRVFVYGFPITYILAPYLALIPSTSNPPQPVAGVLVWAAICTVLFIFVVSRTFVLPATMILINNCSPHPSVLGTVHGVAQSVGSAARTCGPAVAGFLFGVGLDKGVVGLAWWMLAVAGAFAVCTSMWVREGTGHEIVLEDEEEDEDDDGNTDTARETNGGGGRR